MNSREHLSHIIESGFPDDPRDGEECLPALRELDQLLQSSLGIMREAIANGDWKVDGRCDPDSLFRRLAQAGYGDK